MGICASGTRSRGVSLRQSSDLSPSDLSGAKNLSSVCLADSVRDKLAALPVCPDDDDEEELSVVVQPKKKKRMRSYAGPSRKPRESLRERVQSAQSIPGIHDFHDDDSSPGITTPWRRVQSAPAPFGEDAPYSRENSILLLHAIAGSKRATLTFSEAPGNDLRGLVREATREAVEDLPGDDDSRDPLNCESALEVAIKAGNTTIVETMIHEIPLSTYGRALEIACHYNQKEILSILLGSNARAVLIEDERLKCVKLAIEKGHHGALEKLHQAGFKLNRDIGYTPTLPWSRARGPMPEAFIEETNRPLHAAAALGHVNVVRFLLSHGFEMEIHRNDYDAMKPLHFAVQANSMPCVSLLLQAKASIESEDGRGHTPLALAATFNHAFIVKQLVKMSANVNAMNDRKESVLMLAALAHRSDQLVQFLLEQGAELTPLSKKRKKKESPKTLKLRADLRSDGEREDTFIVPLTPDYSSPGVPMPEPGAPGHHGTASSAASGPHLVFTSDGPIFAPRLSSSSEGPDRRDVHDDEEPTSYSLNEEDDDDDELDPTTGLHTMKKARKKKDAFELALETLEQNGKLVSIARIRLHQGCDAQEIFLEAEKSLVSNAKWARPVLRILKRLHDSQAAAREHLEVLFDVDPGDVEGEAEGRPSIAALILDYAFVPTIDSIEVPNLGCKF